MRVIPTPEEVPALKVPPFATWIPQRDPKFKVHNNLGQAKQAMKCQLQRTGSYNRAKGGYQLAGGSVFQLMDGQWVLRWVIEHGMYPDDHHFLTASSSYLMHEPVDDTLWITEFIEEVPT